MKNCGHKQNNYSVEFKKCTVVLQCTRINVSGVGVPSMNDLV